MITSSTRTLFAGSLLAAMAAMDAVQAAEPGSVKFTVQQPAHGKLTFTPSLSPEGQIAAGTLVKVTATADAGYALDTVWQAVPGVFGLMYTESRAADYSVKADADKTVGALFLPAAELSGWRETLD